MYTQKRKMERGLIDAHFARGSQHVDAFIGEGNDAATPKQVYDALISNGDVNRSTTQLISIDRKRMEELEAVVEPVCKQFKQSIPRANEIVYGQEEIGTVPVDALASLDAQWTVSAFDYSGIGSVRRLALSILRFCVYIAIDEHTHRVG